jgi:hypothetical protein
MTMKVIRRDTPKFDVYILEVLSSDPTLETDYPDRGTEAYLGKCRGVN